MEGGEGEDFMHEKRIDKRLLYNFDSEYFDAILEIDDLIQCFGDEKMEKLKVKHGKFLGKRGRVDSRI
jgi:hypothetical protein